MVRRKIKFKPMKGKDKWEMFSYVNYTEKQRIKREVGSGINLVTNIILN